MTVALRHGKAPVAQQFPDGQNRSSLQGQPTGKRVPKGVERDLLTRVRDSFIETEPLDGSEPAR